MTSSLQTKCFDELYIEGLLWDISRKYKHKLSHYLYTAKQLGEHSLHMNFDICDFKPKHAKYGRPIDIQRLWLAKVVSPELPNLKWDAWNNGSFTVCFKW